MQSKQQNKYISSFNKETNIAHFQCLKCNYIEEIKNASEERFNNIELCGLGWSGCKNCMKQNKWDLRYLELAKFVSKWSKDPSTQTGAVIVKGNNVILGYNGLPEGMLDDDRLNNREWKYEKILHCEVNAILKSKESLSGSTLYTFPFHSCSRCASIVIQSGIKRCVAPINKNPRWIENLKLSAESFKECGVELVLYDFE